MGNSKAVSMKKSTAVVVVVALLGAGALASWSMQGITPAPSVMGSQPSEDSQAAVELLAQHGKNATILEPTMLYYTDCIVCYTCGERWYHKVAEVNRGHYMEFHGGCRDPYHYVSSDNAYICCSR